MNPNPYPMKPAITCHTEECGDDQPETQMNLLIGIAADLNERLAQCRGRLRQSLDTLSGPETENQKPGLGSPGRAGALGELRRLIEDATETAGDIATLARQLSRIA